MSTRSPSVYQPGVCNIGPAEIRRRRMSGWIGAIVTIVAVVLFVVFDVAAPIRLVTLVPAALAASGFLQAGLHFCADFGMRGLFNVTDGTGSRESVMEADFRKADQRKATQILVFSLLIGVAAAVIAFFLP